MTLDIAEVVAGGQTEDGRMFVDVRLRDGSLATIELGPLTAPSLAVALLVGVHELEKLRVEKAGSLPAVQDAFGFAGVPVHDVSVGIAEPRDPNAPYEVAIIVNLGPGGELPLMMSAELASKLSAEAGIAAAGVLTPDKLHS